MKKMSVIIVSLLFLFLYYSAPIAYATQFSVDGPTDLVRGQTYDYKVMVDTQGASLSKQEFLVTYDTKYVTFKDGDFLAGDFFDNVTYNKQSEGKLYVVATSNTPKSGTGLVAVIKLTLNLDVPAGGTTTICAATPIDTTPTPVPTNAPTALPKTGSIDTIIVYSLFGVSLLSLSALIRVML